MPEPSAAHVNARKTTFTYCHYAREYCQTGHAHHPEASPFREMKPWPARGYRREDFPRTESIIHNFLALPIGVRYSDEDADYIITAMKQVHRELLG